MSHDRVRAAMTADDELDDLARARIWNALEERLAEPARRRARWPALAGALALGAAAAALALVVLRRGDAPTTWTVAADATLASRLGPHARAALVGPAELEVLGSPGASTTVRLRSGTLLADFAGGPGRALRIEAPGVVVDVIGTVFAVEVREAETCVSVLHGRVRLNHALELTTGTTFCTSSGARPIAPAVRDALERHEQLVVAHAASGTSGHADEARSETERSPNAVGGSTRSPNAVEGSTATEAGSETERSRNPVAGSVAGGPGHADRRTLVVRAPTATDDRIPPTETETETETETADLVLPTETADRVPPTETADLVPPTETADRVRPPVTTTARVPVVTEPPRPSPRPATPTSADDLYQQAEAALATRDLQGADRALGELIVKHPSSSLVEQAHYERARLAHQAGAWGTARQHLDRLLALPSPRLAEPARYLACRIAVETRDAGAAGCLADYRAAYPRSPHARDVLGLLVELDVQRGGCRAAAPRIAELARVYPGSKLAVAWRTRCPEAR